MKDKVLIIGYGEVGQAISKCVEEADYEVEIEDCMKRLDSPVFKNPIAMLRL